MLLHAGRPVSRRSALLRSRRRFERRGPHGAPSFRHVRPLMRGLEAAVAVLSSSSAVGEARPWELVAASREDNGSKSERQLLSTATNSGQSGAESAVRYGRRRASLRESGVGGGEATGRLINEFLAERDTDSEVDKELMLRSRAIGEWAYVACTSARVSACNYINLVIC